MRDFWQNEGGTSHAGKSRKLSKYNKFETEIQVVSGSKKGNSLVILFEGDGFNERYIGFKGKIADGAKYLDRTTGLFYVGGYDGEDVVFSLSQTTPLDLNSKVDKGVFSDNQVLRGDGDSVAQGSSVVIDDNGYIGAGVNPPTKQLEVKDTVQVSGDAYPKFVWNATGNTADERKWQSYILPSGEFRLGSLNDAETIEQGGIIIDRVGNLSAQQVDVATKIGVGTDSPTEALDVRGMARFGNPDTQGATVSIDCVDVNGAARGINLEEVGSQETWQIGVNSTGSLCFYDSNSPTPSVAFNDGTGNVGIATNTPSQKLEVDGNIQISGSSSRSLKFDRSGAIAEFNTSSAHLYLSLQTDKEFRVFGQGAEQVAFGDNGRIRVNIPTSPVGLVAGDLWNDGGVVKVI